MLCASMCIHLYMKQRLISFLRWSEQYTKTDMVYLTSGAFWGNFNSLVIAVLGLCASIFFAKYLTKEAYGTYQYILSIASLIGATTLTGMNAAITRAVAQGYEGEVKHSVWYQLKAGIVPFLIGCGVAAWYFIHGNKLFGYAFVWIAIFTPLANSFNTWAAYTGGKKLFRIGSYYGFFNNIVSYGATLLTLYLTQSFVWVLFVNFLVSFISSFIIYNLVIRHVPPNTERDPETLSYGKHLSIMGILGVLVAQVDSLLVFHFIGPAVLAVYSFATLIPERIAGMLKLIPNIALPKLSEKTEEEARAISSKKLWTLMGFLLLCAIGYAALAPFVFKTFFPAYTDSILLTQVYSLSFFSIAALFVQTTLMSQRKVKQLYVVNTVIPFLRIGLMALFMYFWGIWGLLSAQILNNFISLGLQSYLLWRKPGEEEARV